MFYQVFFSFIIAIVVFVQELHAFGNKDLSFVPSDSYVRDFSFMQSSAIKKDVFQETIALQDNSLFHSDPGYIQDIPLPQDPTQLQMQEQQPFLMKKEFHGNPAKSDILYYKQNEAIKQIQKDPTLQIQKDRTPVVETDSVSGEYEFIIQYSFKIVDEVPYGEEYKISTPLTPLFLEKKYKQTTTCTINTKETSFEFINYPHYTKAEMHASKRKQIQYLLYNFLLDYKHEILECLMLNQTYLDDINMTLNLISRTKTIVRVRAYVLVDFHGGVLHFRVFDPKEKK